MTLGIFLVSKGQVDFQGSLRRMLRYPMFYAVALAFTLRCFQIPVWQPLFISIERISSALVPVALITLGANMAKVRLNYRLFDVILSALFRLLAAPLITLLSIATVSFFIYGAAILFP
ncbi:hypothetical protein LCGC14_2043130 [marine sediment metagenome]|uniref:Uncharacterized protein n=1 Tax=marine sediment metagenome TaxID=412755 RepID=A0A0F9H4P5_9ZZZZ|nr:hypothetical protein [Spirochaetota bacterium]